MYEPIFEYPKPESFRVPDEIAFIINDGEKVKELINEVLPEVLTWEKNSYKAGLILEGMLEEPPYEATNRDEVKNFLINHFKPRASTFNKISAGLEAMKEK